MNVCSASSANTQKWLTVDLPYENLKEIHQLSVTDTLIFPPRLLSETSLVGNEGAK